METNSRIDQLTSRWLKEIEKAFETTYQSAWAEQSEQIINQVAEHLASATESAKEIQTLDELSDEPEIRLWQIKNHLNDLINPHS